MLVGAARAHDGCGIEMYLRFEFLIHIHRRFHDVDVYVDGKWQMQYVCACTCLPACSYEHAQGHSDLIQIHDLTQGSGRLLTCTLISCMLI